MLRFTIFALNFFECFVLLFQHLVVLFQCILVHNLEKILVLFVLVLKIGHARLISLREQVLFLLVGQMQFFFHLFECLDIEFSLDRHIGLF